jgi:hypothetical protein
VGALGKLLICFTFNFIDMKRENGFYWIRLQAAEWQVAEWEDECFYLTGYEGRIRESQVEEIDERQITRITGIY